VLQTSAVNTPRFEKEGLLIEGASTNYFLNSDDPSKWSAFDANTTRATLTDGDTKAITMKATTTDLSPSSWYVARSNGVAVVAGDYLSISARIKGKYGKCELRFVQVSTTLANVFIDFETGEITNAPSSADMYATVKKGTDGYTYVTATFKSPVDATLSGAIVVALPASNIIAPVGTDYYIQTIQFEKMHCATSYIPTTDSIATRAAEDCTLQRAGNDNWWNPITIAIDAHCNGLAVSEGTSNSRRGILAYYPTTTEWAMMFVDISGSNLGKFLVTYGPLNYNASLERVDNGLSHRLVAVSDTLQNRGYVDGVPSAASTATSRPTPGNTTAVNSIICLGRGAGSTVPGVRMLNGHIRNLRIWHQALSAEQIKGL